MANIKEYSVVKYQNGSFVENISDEKFILHQFTDFSANDKEIKNCDFSYALFTRVYFRKVVFTNCNFTGAKFFDSNLRDASFINCKFPYAIFKFTIIRSKQVLHNLPEWPNVKINLLQNHKANANSLGDFNAVREYLLEEIEANKEHYRRARARKEHYYSEKYKSFRSQVEIYWKSFCIYIDDFLWGHGESPMKIIRNVIVIIIILTLIQFSFVDSVAKNTIGQDWKTLWVTFKDSWKVFIGFGNIKINGWCKAILIVFRYITFGFFVRILFNKYAWR